MSHSTADSQEPTSTRAAILVSGRVQGVGYRAFTVRAASARKLSGVVRNLDDGRVELDVEGSRHAIEALLEELKKGPPASRVTEVRVEWGKATGRYSEFGITY